MHAVIKTAHHAGNPEPYVFIQIRTLENSQHDPPTQYLEILAGGGLGITTVKALAGVADLLEEAWTSTQTGIETLARWESRKNGDGDDG